VRKRSGNRLRFALFAGCALGVIALGLLAAGREVGPSFPRSVKRDLHRFTYRVRGWLSRLQPRHWTEGALAYQPPADAGQMSGAALRFGQLPPDFQVPSGWRPFFSDSTWNQRLGPDPKLDANDRAKIAWTFSPLFNDGLTTNQFQVTNPFDPKRSSGTPLYFAKDSDPQVYLQCNARYGPHKSNDCPLPKTIFVPAQAAAANDSDHHIIIVQPDGREIDVWEWGTGNSVQSSSQQRPPWVSGETIQVQWGGVADVLTGTGWDDGLTNGAATVSGSDLLAGFVSASDIRAGRIDHALAIDLYCNPVANVYPAPIGGNANPDCNGAATIGDAPVGVGARFWLDTPDATIDTYHVPIGEKALLHALHDFGAFHIDTNHYAFEFVGLESPLSGVVYGNNFATPIYAQSFSDALNGFAVGITGEGTGDDDFDTYVKPHLHVLDPCVNNGYPGGQCRH